MTAAVQVPFAAPDDDRAVDTTPDLGASATAAARAINAPAITVPHSLR